MASAAPSAAASWRRRDWAMSRPLPSATTQVTAGDRKARSMAHTRSACVGGSRNTQRSRSPRRTPPGPAIASGDGQQRRPIHSRSEEEAGAPPSALAGSPRAASLVAALVPAWVSAWVPAWALASLHEASQLPPSTIHRTTAITTPSGGIHATCSPTLPHRWRAAAPLPPALGRALADHWLSAANAASASRETSAPSDPGGSSITSNHSCVTRRWRASCGPG